MCREPVGSVGPVALFVEDPMQPPSVFLDIEARVANVLPLTPAGETRQQYTVLFHTDSIAAPSSSQSCVSPPKTARTWSRRYTLSTPTKQIYLNSGV